MCIQEPSGRIADQPLGICTIATLTDILTELDPSSKYFPFMAHMVSPGNASPTLTCR